MNRLFFTLLSLLFVCSLFPQIAEFKKDYTPLLSTGLLPEVYTKSASEKAREDLSVLSNSKGVQNRSAKKKFYLSSNFQQDRILRSGKLLFNDPISKFVNRVADEAFRSAPQVRKQLQIFIVKSEVVNAYCFDNGIVLVNSGLIAQLDNEAQLAYILCHEASHYIMKHSLDSYVHSSRRRSRFSANVDLDEYKYSQESELEADIEGVKYYKGSRYSYKGIVGAFNVLKYSYLPFDEIQFNKDFFEDSNLVFPKDLFLEEVSPIKKEEDYDDSKSSHPNIKRRKEAVGRELGEFSDDQREKFVVDQNEFYRVREMARFESCRIELLNRDYAACIYDCYLLLKKYPDNAYLKTTVGKALFEVAALKSSEITDYRRVLRLDMMSDDDGGVTFTYSDKEGHVQQVYHLLNVLNATQSSILALNYNWKLRKEQKGQNKTVNRLCDSLFVLLALNNSVDLSYFTRTSRRQYLEDLKNKNAPVRDSLAAATAPKEKKLSSLADLDEAESDSKTTRIEEKKDQAKKDSVSINRLEQYFDKYVFADFFSDEEFVKKYKAAIAVREALNERRKVYTTTRSKRNKGGLGIDTLVILNPFYLKLDERRQGIRYFASDEKLDAYGDVLRKNAKIAGINYEYIDSKSLNSQEMERYNDYTIFNDWMAEFLNHNFNSNALVLNNDAAALLKKKYHTRYVLWSGVINVRVKKKDVGLAIIATILAYPLAIYTIPYLLRKEQQTYYVSLLYDFEHNKLQFYHTVVLRMSDSPDFLNAFVYDTMLSIKKQPKFKR